MWTLTKIPMRVGKNVDVNKAAGRGTMHRLRMAPLAQVPSQRCLSFCFKKVAQKAFFDCAVYKLLPLRAKLLM